MKTAEEVLMDFQKKKKYFLSKTERSISLKAMEAYASQFKPIPPSTESYIISYPVEGGVSGTVLNGDFCDAVDNVISKYKIYKNNTSEEGRQKTSQEGLRELVDWMENGTWVGYKDDLLYFIIAKANEILNR